ncbi:methyltransferase domain-containing protein [Gordonia desulfuricans]|uniref:Methyltransferase domain-containing protein n=1 Tax=Gordonia desulfuricans TaxID=89051 RepID=A0A7K3LRT7_9ACTN|nr:methyltransferase domain-containing protein [Gordonia desulfuricans]NDK90267.1 methyltransferase domain-containing protein [Gordonia desulfuricans]
MSFDVAGDAYDNFMGRYSQPLAQTFTDWLPISPGQRALDVGCGPGAWAAVLARRLGPRNVSAVDPSSLFVAACRATLPDVDVRQAKADALPYADDTFDVVGANLVVSFMPNPRAGLSEMARVTRPGGRIAATVWDLAGGRAPMAPVWTAFDVLGLPLVDETHMPGGAPGEIASMLDDIGLTDVTDTELVVRLRHNTFDEWWEPYLHAVGPIGEAVAALAPAEREQLRAACREALGPGPFDVTAVAHAARATV